MGLFSMFGNPKPKAPEVPMQAAPEVPVPPANLFQMMTAGTQPQKQGKFDEPWRRALFSASASLLDSPGMSPVSALGRAAGVGLQQYDNTRQMQAQGALKDRELRTEEALKNYQMTRMAADDAKKAKAEADRAKLMEEFKLTESMTPEQKQVALANIAMRAASIGQTDIVGAISQMMQSVGSLVPKAPTLREVDLGDRVDMVDPSGKVVQSFKKGTAPRAPGVGGQASDIELQRRFQREDALTDDYRRDTDSAFGVLGVIQQANTALPRALQGDGAAQVQALYGFMKALDPESAVREGEVALARSASSMYATAQGIYNKYLAGQPVVVSKEMLEAMGRYMKERERLLRTNISDTQSRYRDRGKRWNVDPSAFRDAPGSTDAAPKPATAAAAAKYR